MVRIRPLRYALPLLCPALLACPSPSTGNPVRTAFAGRTATHGQGASLAFRFPTAARNRNIRLYRLPGLTEAAWHIDDGGIGTGTLIGFATDDDYAFGVTDQNELTLLDVAVGKVRVVDTGIILAALGPTGTPLAVKRDLSIVTVLNRVVAPWVGAKLPNVPERLWGGTGGQAVAVVPTDSGRQLVLLSQGQATVMQRLASGPVAASLWADVVAVGSDSGVLFYEPATVRAPGFVQLRTKPRAIAVSPSGNAVYAVAEERDVLIIDRFQARLTQRIKLPAEGSAIRSDP